MEIYCLFCEPGKGEYVRLAAEILYDCRAIYPKQVQHRRKTAEKSKKNGGKEEPRDVLRNLMPGYVFLYFEGQPPDVSYMNGMMGVVRCLSHVAGATREYELTGTDREFALMLLSKDGVLGKTKVYEVGDRIQICDGAFSGVSTTILKVDRRNGCMQVEIPFANQLVKTWLQYEIVKAEDP